MTASIIPTNDTKMIIKDTVSVISTKKTAPVLLSNCIKKHDQLTNIEASDRRSTFKKGLV